MHTQRTTWQIGDRYTWTPHGGFAETPSDALDNVGQLVTRIAAALHKADATEGLVLLEDGPARRLGLFAADPAAALDSAAAAGWRTTGTGPWTTFYAKPRPTVHIGVLPALSDPRNAEQWLFRGLYPADAVTALQAFQDGTGVAWQAGPAVMGIELIHRTLTAYTVPGQKGRRKPDLQDDSTPAEAGVSMWTTDAWRGPGKHGRYLHSYDRRRAGITAAGVAKCSPSRLTRGRRKWDPGRAGWWLISVPAWNVREMPHPCGPGAAVYSRLWVTTATMDLCAELAAAGVLSMPDIIDSLTGPARTVLAPWQKALERTYQRPTDEDYDDVAQGLVRYALKEAGNRGIGMLAKADGRSSIWRRDWNAAVNATKQANAWRIAWRIGNAEQRWPVAFADDAVWYGSDIDDPRQAAPRAINPSSGLPLLNLADTAGGYRTQDTVTTRTKGTTAHGRR